MYIIEPEGINDLLIRKNRYRFVDCRFSLTDENWGEIEYQKKHIAGAVYFHLEKDLSGPVQVHGGRHPLPNLSKFKLRLEESGIDNDTVVFAYDQGGAPFAARFWWLMKYVGHKNVYVVNGGYPRLVEVGFQTEEQIPRYQKCTYEIQLQPQLFADVTEVKEVVAGKKDAILIDSREYKRYIGEIEPIDKKAGHIPGAIHKDWQSGIASGRFKDKRSQKDRFHDLPLEKEIIVYCGSGVTAAPNMLLLKDIGFPNVKLYIGSFSDWISYPENNVATKDSLNDNLR
ncbi:sulfurtransferase [Bacillus kwashiorkori]|uniref:sulfurtransferase n=1 Tax=Bacillus kwashiorkori TaxID=1522318 RepID=UPI000782BA93|nr:sulfurtransferase [Bacillus kwashiorkori]